MTRGGGDDDDNGLRSEQITSGWRLDRRSETDLCSNTN